MEKVIFKNKGGIGLILLSDECITDYVNETPITLVDETIQPNQYTDLKGLLTDKIKYVGLLKDKKNCMVMEQGGTEDLFGVCKFYTCFFLIDKTILVTKHTEKNATAFRYINGTWQY